MKFGLSKHDLDLIQKVLKHFPEVKGCVFFGSRVRGDYEKGSDIDIALKGNVNLDRVSRIKKELDHLPLPYFFDVVDYEHLDNDDLRKAIEREGISVL